ncbi:MAG: hypothetical protein II146_06960, partial [Treponema sp.]|nr:hypothetical protein [Treponema sp.]
MKSKFLRSTILAAATLTLLLCANSIFAEEEADKDSSSSMQMLSYPLIESLDSRNVLFKQYQEAVQDASMAEIRGDLPSALEFYSYKAKKKDT